MAGVLWMSEIFTFLQYFVFQDKLLARYHV